MPTFIEFGSQINRDSYKTHVPPDQLEVPSEHLASQFSFLVDFCLLVVFTENTVVFSSSSGFHALETTLLMFAQSSGPLIVCRLVAGTPFADGTVRKDVNLALQKQKF